MPDPHRNEDSTSRSSGSAAAKRSADKMRDQIAHISAGTKRMDFAHPAADDLPPHHATAHDIWLLVVRLSQSAFPLSQSNPRNVSTIRSHRRYRCL